MVGWIILGVLVVLITAINLIPLGVDVSFIDDKLRLSAKAAGVRLQLIPKPPEKEEKPKKEKKPKEKKEKPPKEEKPASKEKKGLPLGLTLDDVLEIVKKVLHHLNRFKHKFCVDNFLLHFTASEVDPYYTAMTYAYVNEVLCILAPMCRRSFKVKKSDVSTDLDFMSNRFRLDIALEMSIRIGQIVGLVFAIAFAALGVVLKAKSRQKKEAKKQAKLPHPASDAAEDTEINKQTIQDEERMAANG